jgi:hypothetical protein
MYALFEGNKQIGDPFPTEKEVWEAALMSSGWKRFASRGRTGSCRARSPE